MRILPLAALILGAALLPAPARANPGAAAGGAAFSEPLPSPELPTGVLTVKVVGASLADIKVGSAVELQKGQGETFVSLESTLTGADGRARFSGLTPGALYRLAAALPSGPVVSSPFAPPATGGVRLLLSLGQAMQQMTGGAAPASGGMPAGHPPTGQAHAHGMAPNQALSRTAATVKPAEDLPAGAVEVVVRQGKADPKPVAGAPLTVTRQVEVVRGPDGAGRLAVKGGQKLETDAAGRASATLEQPAEGEGPQSPYRVVVEHEGRTYASPELPATTEQGVRVEFSLLGRSRDASAVRIGADSQLIMQMEEERLSFMQLLWLENRGETIYDPGADGPALPLPRGATGVELSEASQTLAKVGSDRASVRLTGALPPGQHELRYFYSVPLTGASETLAFALPLASAGGLVVPLSDAVKVDGPAVRGSEQRSVGQGQETRQRQIYLLGPQKAGETLLLTVTGLPHRDTTLLTAVLVAAGLLLLWGLAATARGRHRAAQDRQQADALLRELARLERSGLTTEEQRQRYRQATRDIQTLLS